jgi:murein DD-endopeptidase MepM/ murein hydrolase activator NlpD
MTPRVAGTRSAPRRRSAIPIRVLAAALATTLLIAGSAAGDPGSVKARIDARIGDLKAQAGQAAGTEGVLTTELSGLTSRVRVAETAATTEQARLDALEAALVAERARLASLEVTIAGETAQLAVLERQYATALAVLEQRLRDVYESDPPDLIAFALGTTSFSDLLDNLEVLNRIGQQDQRIASSLDRTRTALQQTRAATEHARQGAVRSAALIASRTEAQRATRDRVLANRDAVAAAESDKARALATVREDRASFVAEADGLAAQSAALAEKIAAAQSADATASTASVPAPSSSGAQLVWPVAGPVTSGFGSRWGRMHEGIDIAVGSGTPVHAAAAGTVVYAGWLSGYGNIVVIDHGNGLSTAYAHNSSLIVGQGAVVGTGFVVALSGSTGHSTGPHVHFEVRVNGTPVDPLGYL